MFGLGKKSKMKKEMQKVDRLSSDVKEMFDKSEKEIREDESLYTWQKRKRLKSLQGARLDAAIEIGNRRKAIRDKYKNK